jgi:phosphate transport system protein
VLTPPPESPSADLESLEGQVVHLFALIAEGLAAVTGTFLDSDRDTARHLVANEQLIDSIYESVESAAREELVSGTERAEEHLQYLLLILQIVPEIERSGDLIEHIAQRARQGLARSLTPSCRGLVERMGEIATEMWQLAGSAYAVRDAGVAVELRLRDDELDDLHVRLTAELADAPISMAAAIEMGLVARFFERLGDHAVNVARRWVAKENQQ